MLRTTCTSIGPRRCDHAGVPRPSGAGSGFGEGRAAVVGAVARAVPLPGRTTARMNRGLALSAASIARATETPFRRVPFATIDRPTPDGRHSPVTSQFSYGARTSKSYVKLK